MKTQRNSRKVFPPKFKINADLHRSKGRIIAKQKEVKHNKLVCNKEGFEISQSECRTVARSFRVGHIINKMM